MAQSRMVHCRMKIPSAGQAHLMASVWSRRGSRPNHGSGPGWPMLTTRTDVQRPSGKNSASTRRVEAGHRARGQAVPAHREQEVPGLQRAAEPHGLGPHRVVGRERVPQFRPERDELRDVLVELRVHREHRDGRRGGGLGLVSVVHVPDQPLPPLRVRT